MCLLKKISSPIRIMKLNPGSPISNQELQLLIKKSLCCLTVFRSRVLAVDKNLLATRIQASIKILLRLSSNKLNVKLTEINLTKLKKLRIDFSRSMPGNLIK
jgi:hypothetical protein